MTFIPFTILTVFLYFGFARAELTRPIWSRYAGFVDKLARCPACSGTWIGAALSYWLPPPFVEYVPVKVWIVTPLWGAALGCVVTPVAYWIFMKALEATVVEVEAPLDKAALLTLLDKHIAFAEGEADPQASNRHYWHGRHEGLVLARAIITGEDTDEP